MKTEEHDNTICPPCWGEGTRRHLWVWEDENEDERGFSVIHICAICDLIRYEHTLWGGRPVVSFEREEWGRALLPFP